MECEKNGNECDSGFTILANTGYHVMIFIMNISATSSGEFEVNNRNDVTVNHL